MKLANIIVSGVIVLVFACLAFFYFVMDYRAYFVRSESMKPIINMGDLVIVAPTGSSLTGQIEPGMIITYSLNKALITHRVVSVNGDSLVTKGDASEERDPRSVSLSQVKGSYLFKIPYIGYFNSFARTRNGWFAVIVLPAMLLVGLIIKDIVKEALRSS